MGYECLHKLRSCKSRKGGIIALKLDISKAYDRVEWIFLENVMIRLGFSERWVKLILACVTSSTFSFMINGKIRGMVRPQRGLRQGCPLSPYLFILCAKVFSSLIHVAETANLIREVRFSKDLMVSHLFFADDSLIFCRAATRDCCSLKEIFNIYSAASGQCFNFEKSSVQMSVLMFVEW